MRLLVAATFFTLTTCQAHPNGLPTAQSDVSSAWVTFGPDRPIASGAFGLADRRSGRALTVDDPVRVASISKMVVALGVMRLVEVGRLDLDADVSRWLGWELRNPAYPDTSITLRMLLSHQSSLQDAGEAYVIPLGQTLRVAVTGPVFDAAHAPGTFFRYSNLNFPVIASVLERATGERFDRLMERLVADPLGLEICFNWTTCGDAALARATVLYGSDGAVVRDDLGGRQPLCPVATIAPDCDLSVYTPGSNGALFSPQGGLRASAADLATIGQLVLNRGRHRETLFLSEASIDAVTRPVWTFEGRNGDTGAGFYCAYGLGTQTLPVTAPGCRDDLFGDGRRVVGHAGDAYGVRSGLWIDLERRVGIAYFAANNGPEPLAGRSAYRAIEEQLAAKLRD